MLTVDTYHLDSKTFACRWKIYIALVPSSRLSPMASSTVVSAFIFEAFFSCSDTMKKSSSMFQTARYTDTMLSLQDDQRLRIIPHQLSFAFRSFSPTRKQTGDIADMTEDDYLVEAPQFREALSATDIGNWNVEEQIKTDEGNSPHILLGICVSWNSIVEERQNIPSLTDRQGRCSASENCLARHRKDSFMTSPRK